jgi:hypothetical protein
MTSPIDPMTLFADIRSPHPDSQRRVWGVARLSALILTSLMIAGGLSLVSMRASAAFLPVQGAQGPHLRLQSDPSPAQFLDLSPGSVAQWQISASVVDTVASLTVEFVHGGALVTQPIDGLQVQVQRCDAPWSNVATSPACSENRQNVFGPAAASSMPVGTHTNLGGITSARDKFLLVTMSLPNTAYARADKSLQGLSGTLSFGLTAADATATTTTVIGTNSRPVPALRPKVLAFTGADAVPLGLLALGAAGLGIIISGARKIRASNAGRQTP